MGVWGVLVPEVKYRTQYRLYKTQTKISFTKAEDYARWWELRKLREQSMKKSASEPKNQRVGAPS
jgi:hypothetical protein